MFPALRSLHIERVIGVITLAAIFFEQYRHAGKLSLEWSRQTRLLLLVIVAIMLSIPFAYWRYQAVSSLVEFLKLLAWYIMIVQLVSTRRRLRLFIGLFLALLGYSAWTALRSYLGGSFQHTMGIDRAMTQVGMGGHGPNALGAAMAITIPMMTLLALHRELRWFRILPTLGIVLMVVTMVVTGSRSAFLGFLGMLGFLFLRSKKKVLVGALGILILLVGSQVVPEQYAERYRSIVSDERDGSSRHRMELWSKGLHMMTDRPLTGVGVGCFMTANAKAYSPEGNPDYSVGHNLYVEVPAEIGIIGALVYFAFILEMYRLNRQTHKGLVLSGGRWEFEAKVIDGVAAGMVVMLITGFFGGNFMRYTWYVYAALGAATARILSLVRDSSEGGQT